MKPIRDKVILEAALAKYGTDAQMRMAVEEMSELTKSLCKLWRAERDLADIADLAKLKQPVESILEEIADVRIMLDQLELIFGSTEEVREEKLMRLALRLITDPSPWVADGE